ncbi:MAG: hypothetical protein WAO58_10680 [Fimbriimonadaceae bacterium]
MIRKLVKNGNSKGLILSKDMLDHLQVRESVSVEYGKDMIVLRKPMEVEDVLERARKKWDKALRNLAK